MRTSISGSFLVALIVFSSSAFSQTPTHYLDNGTIRVGISTVYGGAITHLSYLGGPNWIDNGLPDPGRQVQISFYDTSESYPACWPCNGGCTWGWNPVLAGNCANFSGTLSVMATATKIQTRAQPLQWEPDLGRSNVLVDQSLTLPSARLLKILYTITNDEIFSFGNGASHELPVAYLNTILSRAMVYDGAIPYSFDPPTELSIPNESSVSPVSTEPWVAWLNAGGEGLALYIPRQGYFYGWAMGRLGSPSVPATNYLQGWSALTFAPGERKSMVAYLIAGTVAEIQESVYSLEENNREAWIDLGASNVGAELIQIDRTNGQTMATTIAGVDCRITLGGEDIYMNFDVDALAISEADREVIIRYSYYDDVDYAGAELRLNYRSTSGNKLAIGPIFAGSGEWRVHEFVLGDAQFDGGYPDGTDFRLRRANGGSPEDDLAIDRVEVHRIRCLGCEIFSDGFESGDISAWSPSE